MARKSNAAAKRAAPKRSNAGKGNVRTKADKLSPQHEKFAQHFALTGNAADAVRQAYPEARTKGDQYLAERGWKLRTTDKILKRIDELKSRAVTTLTDRFDVTVEKIVQEVAPIVFANPADYYEFGYNDVPEYDRKTLQPIIDPHTGKQRIKREPFAYAKPSAQLTPAQMKAIVGATMTTSKTGDKTIEVKLGNKLAAAQMLLNLLTKTPEAVQPAPVNLNVIGAVQVSSPADIRQVADPREALKQFEALRAQAMQRLAGPKA